MQETRFTLWLVWGTLLASLAIYAALPLVLTAPGEAMDEGSEILSLCLGLVAIGTAVASFVLKRVLVLGPIARGVVDPHTPAGAQRIQLGYIITWALAESIGVYGLVLYFLTHAVSLMLPFVCGSALLLALHAPRASDLEAAPRGHELANRPDPIG